MSVGMLEDLDLEGNFTVFQRSVSVGSVMRKRVAGSDDVEAVEDHKIFNPSVPHKWGSLCLPVPLHYG